MKLYCTILLLLLSPSLLICQARLILNGGIVKISNAHLVIENPNTNAISRNAGYIDSEGENNNISWHIGTQTGTYIVPFGNSNGYIPLSFNKSNSTGNGKFVFATYPTSWLNSALLPTGITNFTNALGADNSNKVIDRFWKLESNFPTKPDLSNLEFTYLDDEHSVAQNTISEISLQAQRWNSSSMDWGDYPPTGVINTVANTLTIANLSANDLFTWWTLVVNNVMLPIEITDFKVSCHNEQREISWKPNNDESWLKLDLQVSQNGSDWNNLKSYSQIEAKQETMNYFYRAPKQDRYYRLQLTDQNGEYSYSDIAASSCVETDNDILVFPNPGTNGTVQVYFPNPGNFELITSLGQTLMHIENSEYGKTISLTNLPSGIYFLRQDLERSKKITILN